MILQRNSCNIAKFTEKSSNHFFGSIAWTNQLLPICGLLKTLKSWLLFCFRFIRINPDSNTLYDIVYMFRSTRLEFLFIYLFIYFGFPYTISVEHKLQLELNGGRSIGNMPFSFFNDRVKLKAYESLKCSKMFLFHHTSHDDQKR